MEQIKRSEALHDMEVKEDSDGRKHLFSIKFVNKKGEVVYFPYAFSCGLRADMKKNRLRGVVPSAANGLRISDHPTPVCIDNILEYNNKIVIL